MDVAMAAGFFDNQPVVDAYSSETLFLGQPDLHDLSERDAAAGWRRTLSSVEMAIPARGCIALNSEVFIAGRETPDFFQGEEIRRYVLLHPTDGLASFGYPSDFLAAVQTLTEAYTAESWLKDRKFEDEGSGLRPEYIHYFHTSETLSPEMIILSENGDYFRLQAVSRQTGGLLVATGFSLGAAALQTVSYVNAGAYDPGSDSSSAAAPVAVSAFAEFFRANYQYVKADAEKYRPGDIVLTVLVADVTDPAPGDTFTVGGTDYRVLSRQPDGYSCWEVHLRP